MPGPWEKYAAQSKAKASTASSSESGPWNKYKGSAPKDGGFDANAAIQGFGQFATAGYLPELTAVLGKLVPDPTAAIDAKLRAEGFKVDQPEFQGVTTDESRAMQKRLAEESPASYYGGGVAGAIASAPIYSAALKGAGIVREAAQVKAASDAGRLARAGVAARNLGARALQAGKEGAVLGAAANPNTEEGQEGFNPTQRVFNAGVGGLISGAVPVAASAAKGAVDAGVSATKWGATKLVSSLGGVKPEVINEYVRFSERINSAPSVEALKEVSDNFVGKLASDVDAKRLTAEEAKGAFKAFESELKDAYRTAGYDARDAVTSAQQTLKDAHNSRLQQLSGDVYDTIKKLKTDVQSKSGQALETLNRSDAKVDLAGVYSQIDNTIDRLKAAGTDDALSVAQKLQDYKARIMTQNWAKIDAPGAKKLIQGLDQITEYSPMAGAFDKAKNSAFKGIRAALDDSLKGSVPEYAQQMKGVAQDASLLERVSEFGDKQTAAGLLNRLESPNQMERAAALKELGKRYGVDFVEAARTENLPEHRLLQSAQARQEALRPDRVAVKIDEKLANSRQKSTFDAAQGALDTAQEKLSPFKPLAPNNAGQTMAQQKLAHLAKGNNIELEDMFRELGKLTNTDFVQAMKDRNVLAAFEKGATNGSRNTLMGAVLGFLIGSGPGGAAMGAAAGRAVDQWGPAITKKILDGAIVVSKSPSVETIKRLSIPEDAKRNMIIGLENYMIRERAPNVSMVASKSDGRRGVSSDEPKGESKWAADGALKLGITDPAEINALMSSREGKKLLMEASNPAAAGKTLLRIKTQIEKGRQAR